jgi:hypothetical protein
MNVEIETESAQFPEKEYINGVFLAVQYSAVIYLSMPMPKPSCAILEFYIGVHSNSTHFNTKITNITFYKKEIIVQNVQRCLHSFLFYSTSLASETMHVVFCVSASRLAFALNSSVKN